MKKNGHHFYAQAILSEYLRGFLKERDGVRAGTDIESLHRMRVASRRLRSALRVFEDVFYPKKINKWRKRVRKIGRVLGAARELDIQIRFLELIKDRVRDGECRKGIDKFGATLKSRRHAVQKKIVSVLDSPATKEKISSLRSRLKDLSKMKKEGSWEVFRRECEALVLRHLDDLLSYAPFVRQPEKVRELHQMRIAAKNLRYTLEILESFYGKGLKTYSRAAHSIQNILGDLHEYDVWLSSLPCVASQHEDNQDIKKAVSYLEMKCAVLRAASYKKFVRIWEVLEKKKIWQELRKAI